MLKKFIERPVLSTVISIILLLLGTLSLFNLPITLFPDIAPPSVQVTAFYPGANAEVVARSVANPIEEAVNGVENMTYMTSNSSNDGTMTLNVFFKQEPIRQCFSQRTKQSIQGNEPASSGSNPVWYFHSESTEQFYYVHGIIQ